MTITTCVLLAATLLGDGTCGVYSPDGGKIAMQRVVDGKSRVGVMKRGGGALGESALPNVQTLIEIVQFNRIVLAVFGIIRVMKILEKIEAIDKALKAEFRAHAVPIIELIEAQTHDPFCVLVGTILSARTKDACTAGAVKRLFAAMKKRGGTTPAALERLSSAEIEKLIYPVGFYHDKARHLKALPGVLKTKFDGTLPNTVEELCELPGVGRKTANLTVAVGFDLPAICVDVHVHRISNRLGPGTTASSWLLYPSSHLCETSQRHFPFPHGMPLPTWPCWLRTKAHSQGGRAAGTGWWGEGLPLTIPHRQPQEVTIPLPQLPARAPLAPLGAVGGPPCPRGPLQGAEKNQDRQTMVEREQRRTVRG